MEKEKYKIIDKQESQFGRIGIFIGIRHPDGLKVLRFRKKKPPYPTRKDYTCGFYPNQLLKIGG